MERDNMMKAKKLSEEELRKIVGGTSSESFSPFVSFFGIWAGKSKRPIDYIKHFFNQRHHHR